MKSMEIFLHGMEIFLHGMEIFSHGIYFALCPSAFAASDGQCALRRTSSSHARHATPPPAAAGRFPPTRIHPIASSSNP